MAQYDRPPRTAPKPKSMGDAAERLGRAAKATARETFKAAAKRKNG